MSSALKGIRAGHTESAVSPNPDGDLTASACVHRSRINVRKINVPLFSPKDMVRIRTKREAEFNWGTHCVRTSVAAHWAALEDHFQRHANLIDRFRQASPDAVRRMWSSQTNENGDHLSAFEREALIERHCELFGTWPT